MGSWSQQPEKKKHKKRRRSTSSSSSSFLSQEKSSQQPLRFLDLAIDFSLFATLLLVLLLFGGRTPTGQLVLLAGTSLTAGLWFFRRGFGSEYSWKWTGLEPIFLLAAILFSFQLIPLSNSVIQLVSPEINLVLGQQLPAEVIPAAHHSSRWNQVSLSPRETRLSFIAIVCVITLFLIMVQRFQDRKQAKRIVLSLGLGTAAYSIFGIVQLLLSNNKFFWVFEHPFTGTLGHAKASLTNANHFAGLLALSIGPILAWTLCHQKKKLAQKDSWQKNSGSDWHRVIGSLAIASMMIGIVLSGSRGGLILAVVGVLTTLLLIVIKKLADANLPIILSLGGILLLAGTFLVGGQMLEKNTEELLSADFEKLDDKNARSFIWESNLNAWKKFSWVGTGLGTHEDVIPAFHVGNANNMNYTHAENSYLQIGTETGLTGWVLLAVAVLIIFRALYLKNRYSNPLRSDTYFLAGIAGSFCVFLVHGCYDFAWYAPAYMLILGVYLAFLFSHHRTRTEAENSKTNSTTPQLKLSQFSLAMIAVAAGVYAAGSVYPAAIAEQAEFRYQNYSRQGKSFETVEEELQMLRLRVLYLKQSLHADPEQTENHVRMAKCLRRVFELQMKQAGNTMPISQIRAAVYTGGFENPEQLHAWLENPSVMKKSLPLVKACLHHAKQSLQYCPLKSTSYLIQSDLCFIENPDPLLPDYYLSRSELVEPYSPEIPYTAGLHAWQQGEIESAITLWKPVYSRDKKIAKRINEITSVAFPIEVLVETFEPDLNQLTVVVSAYKPFDQQRGQIAALFFAQRVLAETPAMNANEQERLLLHAFSFLNDTKLEKQTSSYIQLASEVQNESLKMHTVFGRWLMKHKKYQLAQPHLQYCLKQSSHDLQLSQLLEKCNEQIRFQSQQMIRPASLQQYRPH